jgi:hypothetical protein
MERRKALLKLELTPQEGSMLITAAERYLRDLRMEMPDFEDLEAGAARGRNRETFITGLLKRLRA